MLVGLVTYSLRFSARSRSMTVRDFLQLAKEVGADGLMLDLYFFPDLKEETLREASEKARNLNLYIELETGGVDPQRLKDAIDWSVAVGATVLRTFLGGAPERFREGLEAWKRKLSRTKSHLREAAAYAEEKGVRIALENHGDIRTDELSRLIEEVASDHVGVCLDTGNQFFLLEDPLETAKKLAPFVFSTHIKAYKVAFCPEGLVVEGCTLFDDDLPNREIVSVLFERSPLGKDLHLNLEVPFERIVVPIFDKGCLEGLGEMSLSEAMKVLRYAKGKWIREVEEVKYSDDIPQREVERLKLSVQRAKEEWGAKG